MNKTDTNQGGNMTKQIEKNAAYQAMKYVAGFDVGTSDINRNGIGWMMGNVRTLKRLNMDEPNWLEGYCWALEAALLK